MQLRRVRMEGAAFQKDPNSSVCAPKDSKDQHARRQVGLESSGPRLPLRPSPLVPTPPSAPSPPFLAPSILTKSVSSLVAYIITISRIVNSRRPLHLCNGFFSVLSGRETEFCLSLVWKAYYNPLGVSNSCPLNQQLSIANFP